MLVGRENAGAPPGSGASTVPLRARSVAAERARQFIKDHPVLMRRAESFWRAVDAVPPPVGTLLQSVKQRMLRETGLVELLLVIGSLESEGIPYWLAGGWGVDVLLGRQTRRHKDIDVVIEDFDHNEPKARRAFLALGFSHVDIDEGGVWMPTRSNFGDEAGHRIEVLAIDWDRVGRAWDFGPGRPSSPTLVQDELGGEVFTAGMMGGREVPCLSARAQLLFHTGFTLEAGGRLNVSLLRSEFGTAP
jgi:lincosamide nucleotidyltransferase A/C/D/E